MDGRLRPILLAYATTGLSKIATIAVQLVALPVVASQVQLENFGALLTLSAIMSFFSIFGQGLSPTVSHLMALALASGNVAAAIKAFWEVLAIGLGFGVVIILVLLILLVAGGDLRWLLGDHSSIILLEMRTGLILVAVHLLIYHISALIEGARAAFAENHITNLYSFGGSAAVLVFSALGAAMELKSIWFFYVTVFVCPAVAQLINLLTFMWLRRQMLGQVALYELDPLQALRGTKNYAVAISSYSLHAQGLVYLTSTLIGLQAAAFVGASVRIFLLLHSSLLSLAAPVLPLITKAHAANKVRSVSRIVLGVLIVGAVINFSFASVFSIAGNDIVQLFVAAPVEPQMLPLLSLGVFYFAYSFSHLGYLIVTALGIAGDISKLFLAAGALTLTLDYFVLQSVFLMVNAGALVLVLVNGVLLTRSLLRVI